MTIQEILDNILHAVFGKDVRQSMHDGVKRANDICEETEARQTVLENKYDLLLRNFTGSSPSDGEIVDARIKEDGMVYDTLGKRLNAMDIYDTEIEAARIKEDGTAYDTLGKRLDVMDAYDTELEAARIKEDGTAYDTLDKRLNAADDEANNYMTELRGKLKPELLCDEDGIVAYKMGALVIVNVNKSINIPVPGASMPLTGYLPFAYDHSGGTPPFRSAAIGYKASDFKAYPGHLEVEASSLWVEFEGKDSGDGDFMVQGQIVYVTNE